MKTINLNNQFYETKNEIAKAVASLIEKSSDVLSANTEGEIIIAHYLSDDDEEGEIIEWNISDIRYNNDGSISSVNIDC